MSVVKLKDGSTETVFTLKDVLEVIEAHMGYDFMRIVDDCFDQYDEIVADYMITYDNYYRINPTDDSARYTVIVENVLDPMIRSMVGSEEADLAATDLEDAARTYLLKAGMPEETLAALTTRLCG